MPESGGDFVQLLDPDGNRVDHPEFSYTGSDAEIAASLRDMVLTRRFDAEATALQRKGELGLWPPSLGQEAAQIGSARAITDRDQTVPSYREHGVAWVRGIDMTALLGVFRGSGMVDLDARASRFQLYSWVIGGHLLLSVGMGMALQRDGLVGGPDAEQNAAVITYFGDGATSPITSAIQYFREEFEAGTHTPADVLFPPERSALFPYTPRRTGQLAGAHA